MTDLFKMLEQTTLEDTQDATSSQASDYGTTHLTSQIGTKILPFGQVAAHVSRFLQQVDKQVRQTIDTYGLNGNASSASANLQFALESKLAQRLPKGGLTMFIKGWKRKATPLGRLYCQLAPSVRPIDESDCGLWPTPDASPRGPRKLDLVQGSQVVRRESRQLRGMDLQTAALWATPNCMDSMKARSLEALERAKTKGGCCNLKDQIHPMLWPTPDASDSRDRGSYNDPCVQRRIAKGRQIGLSMIAQGTGKMEYGSTAQTGNKGSLNPQFPCWLMGIPQKWILSMQLAMLSYRK